MNSYSAARDSSTPSENGGPAPSPSFSRASILGSSGMRRPPSGARPYHDGAALRGVPESLPTRFEPDAVRGTDQLQLSKGAPVAQDRTFVIVGASLAGAKAAEALRTEGHDGRVVLIGAEPHRPYERPPLTKGYL